MVIRSLASLSKTMHHHHPHSFLSHQFPKPTTTHHHHHHLAPFSSQCLSSSPEIINDLSRILSDYRKPHHDIESALNPFSSLISSNIVEQVLKRCKYLGFSAHRFFLWAHQLPEFTHTIQSYHILIDILSTTKQFPLLWDFLTEIKDTQCFEITPDIFWLIFRGYTRANLPADAIRAFNKMVDFGIKPGARDLDQLLHVLCKRKHVRHANQVFDKMKLEFEPSVKTYSILMRGWGDVGEPSETRKLFDEMVERGVLVDMLAYNCVLESLCKGGDVDGAYKLFGGMGSKGLEPDAFTYSIFIHASCEANDLHSVFSVLDRMRRYDLVPNVFTYNCIVKKLCKSDKVDEAYKLLDEMIERGARPDVWTYNAILSFHCDRSEVNNALRLISKMDLDSCQLDRHTYNMVLKMLIRVGRFDRVEKVWESMEERRFYPSVSTYAVMVHGLSKKKGKLEEACKYFEMMIDEGISPYSATVELLRNKLIGLGFSEQTEILADKMERSTSCSIKELSHIMRGNKASARLRNEEENSDESDNWMSFKYTD